MRFFTAVVALLASAGFAVAQTSATTPAATGGACAAQNIVDACKKTIQAQIDSCGPNDWICLCDQWTNMLTCYNNCPNSLDRPPVQNTVTSYCNAAAPLKSSSSLALATAVKTADSSTLATSATATAATAAHNAASGTPSPSASAKAGAAVANVVPAFGGVFAVAMGVAGLL